VMAQNTTAKFISSQQTESSEIQERIINLGKALVEELDLEDSVDTLARWMAHYVAEQIVTAENTTGDEKFHAEQHCFETILKLWQHRSSLPTGHRPFENFESIFRALERLDPESSRPFYYSHPPFRASESGDAAKGMQDDVQKWTNLALGIDRTARILIRFAFSQATLSAADEKTSSWLENAVKLTNSDDLSIVARLLPTDLDDQDEETLEQIRQAHEKDLRSKIEKLDFFTKVSSLLHAALIKELEIVSKEDVSQDVINDSL
jgi:hypothetical protein